MPASSVTEDEPARRRKSVDFARANVGISGLKLTEKHEAHAQRYIDGEIALAEFLKPGFPSSPMVQSGSRNYQGS